VETCHPAQLCTTGSGPLLDALIVRLHIETACRRGGALRLGVEDLDVEDCLVKLREKGGVVRWHPISPTLMTHLLDHVRERGGHEATSQVLANADCQDWSALRPHEPRRCSSAHHPPDVGAVNRPLVQPAAMAVTKVRMAVVRVVMIWVNVCSCCPGDCWVSRTSQCDWPSPTPVAVRVISTQ
jgi:integrase